MEKAGESKDTDPKSKKKVTIQQINSRNQDATTEQLIKYCMNSIAKEENLNIGTTGIKKMLSYKEKFILLRDFLDKRANPQKNRVYQMTKARVQENIKKEEEFAAHAAKLKKLEDLAARSPSKLLAQEASVIRNINNSVASMSPSK